MNDRLVNAKEIVEIIGCGRSTLYKWIKAEKFPQGIKLNGTRKWWFTTIVEYINNGSMAKLATERPEPQNIVRKRLAKHSRKKISSK